MRKALLILLSVIITTPLFSQNQKEDAELTVINMLGGKVYENATFDSKTLTSLPVGKIINIDRVVENTEEFQIGEEFSLAGNWIKPKCIDGFIFSSDLTAKEVEIRTNKHGQIYIDLRGKLKSEATEEKQIETPMGTFPKFFEYKYYENVNYTYTGFDGCFDHIYEYKNLSVNEVYHQMVSDYGLLMNENEFKIPAFSEKTDHKIKFNADGATQDLAIESKENGSIIVSSYDCT